MYVNKADILPKEDLIKFMNDDYSFMYDDISENFVKDTKRGARAATLAPRNLLGCFTKRLKEVFLNKMLEEIYEIIKIFINSLIMYFLLHNSTEIINTMINC